MGVAGRGAVPDPPWEPGSVPQSPYLAGLPPYPFARLDVLRREVEAEGVDVIDLGTGEPGLETPELVRQALVDALPARSTYPRAAGLPALRQAASGWLSRRFGVRADAELDILPVNGTKEAIFSLPLAVVHPEEKPVVIVPDPAYPVYALGAKAAGGEVYRAPLHAGAGFLPDLDAIPEPVWSRAALFWINYPNNPTGAVAPETFLREAATRCRDHGVLLASDEAYVDIYYDSPPATAITGGTDNVLALHTLSKRSAMPGFRTGFMVGDVRVISALKRIRPALGVATPQFIQAAAAAAWRDDSHVDVIRDTLRRRRDLAVRALREAGYRFTDPRGAFYVWLEVPAGQSSESFATRCLAEGVVVLPGNALGEAGEGHVRISLTQDEERLEKALARLAPLSV
jgi:succinyldiaminopimelate transaminase